jgi:hypothetical protein
MIGADETPGDNRTGGYLFFFLSDLILGCWYSLFSKKAYFMQSNLDHFVVTGLSHLGQSE